MQSIYGMTAVSSLTIRLLGYFGLHILTFQLMSGIEFLSTVVV